MSFRPSGPVVLDSSVIIKWFRKHEPLQEQALELRRAYLDGSLFIHVPDLLIYEIANVLRYKPDMDQAKVRQATQSLFDMQIEIDYTGPKIMGNVIEMAYSYDVTVYDAAFVALAEQLEAHFITADEGLAQKLHGVHYVYQLSDLSF